MNILLKLLENTSCDEHSYEGKKKKEKEKRKGEKEMTNKTRDYFLATLIIYSLTPTIVNTL